MNKLFSLFALTLAFAAPLASAADLSVTAANFKPGTGAKFHTGICGTTVTAGQLIAISPSTGKFVLADANDADLCKCIGIAAHGALADQPLAVVWESDDMTLGATLSMATAVYVVSSTAGGIAPAADLSGGGLYPNVVIVAISSTKCVFRAPGIRGTAVSVSS